MGKISGILPDNHRVSKGGSSVLESRHLRTTKPSFIEMGKVTDSKTMPSSIDKSVQAHRELRDWRMRDMAQARLVDDMAADFFVKNSKKPDQMVVTEIPAHSSEAVLSRNEDLSAEMEPVQESASPVVDELDSPPEWESRSLYPKGSFIDYRA